MKPLGQGTKKEPKAMPNFYKVKRMMNDIMVGKDKAKASKH